MISKSPKLLVIGASIYQHHIYHTAQEMGFEIYAIDQNPNAKMLSAADGYRVIDIYDIEQAVAYAEELSVDAVATVNLDQGMKAVNEIQSRLGLPHKEQENVVRATRKDLMREAWSEEGLNPTYQVFDQNQMATAVEYVETTTDQLIVKPVDNAAKRGISRIDSDDNAVTEKLAAAFDASDLDRIIVEEFIDGELFFAPTYVHENGEITTSIISQQITNELVQVQYDGPPEIDADARESITAAAKAAATCFGPGPYHTEVMYSAERGPFLVETSPRVSYATVAITRMVNAFDPVSTLLNDCTPGVELPSPEDPDATYATLRHLEPSPGSKYESPPPEGLQENEHIYEVVPVLETGETVSQFETNDDRVFYVVMFGDDRNEVNRQLTQVETNLLETCFE